MNHAFLGSRYLLGAQVSGDDDVTWVGSVPKFLSAAAWMTDVCAQGGVAHPSGRVVPVRKVVIYDSQDDVTVSSVEFGTQTWSN